MLQRIRTWLETTNSAVGIIGAVATVVIAWYAIKIQTQLHDAEQRREQWEHEITQHNLKVDKSVALFEAFEDSSAIDNLTKISNTVELDLVAKETEYENTDTKFVLSSLLAVKAKEDRYNFYHNMIRLLVEISVIARCGNFLNEREAEICDRETLLYLAGDTIVELFFKLRPALYCDKFIARFEGRRQEFEAVVTAYFQNGKAKTVVYNRRIDIPKEKEDSGDYIVLEFGPEEHCEPWPS